MRVTIIKDDNKVVIDNVAYSVDCSRLPADFHALQWDGQRGEVEFVAHLYANNTAQWHKKPNQVLTDIASYAAYVDAWKTADAEAKKAQADASRPQS